MSPADEVIMRPKRVPSNLQQFKTAGRLLGKALIEWDISLPSDCELTFSENTVLLKLPDGKEYFFNEEEVLSSKNRIPVQEPEEQKILRLRQLLSKWEKKAHKIKAP
jgi:hypothetical protein